MCGERVIDTKRLPKEIQEKVYRPSEDESYNVEVNMGSPERMGSSDSEEVEPENGKIDLGKILLDD